MLLQESALSLSTWKGVVLHEVLDELLFNASFNCEQQSTVTTTSQDSLSHRHRVGEHKVARTDSVRARQETLRAESCHVVLCYTYATINTLRSALSRAIK